MWRLVLLLLITLVRTDDTSEEKDTSDFESQCGDCGELHNSIYINTGHVCHSQDKYALTKNYTQTESAYPKCMPYMYAENYPIMNYCCFWSPQVGCAILIGERYYSKHGFGCGPCIQYCKSAMSGVRRTSYGNLATIPFVLPFLGVARLL